MAYGTPTDPVAGTVITVAYAVANLLDPIRALRAFTGGADPPGTGYVVESSSTSATSWVLVNAAKIISWLGYTPLNKAGDTITPGGLAIAGSLNVGGTTTAGNINAAAIAGSTGVFSGTVNIGGTTTAGAINAGAISGSTGTFSAALSALSAAITNAITAASLTLTGAMNSASAAISGNATVGGTLGVTGAQTNSSTIQATRLISTQATGTAPFTVSSTTRVSNLNAATAGDADTLQGNAAAAFATSGHTHTSMCKITSGTYTGDGGASRSISGLGFAPRVLFIQQTSGSFRMGFMFGHDMGILTGGGSANGVGNSLDGDGFTVNLASGFNNGSTTYLWKAIG